VVQLTAAPEVTGDAVVDLRYLFTVWLKWLWLPIFLASVGLYDGYRDIQAFTPQAVASIIVAPIGDTSNSAATGVTGIAEQFGFQFGPRSTSVSTFLRLKMMLRSVVLAEKLQEQHGLLQILFAGSWDEAAQAWVRPTGADFEQDQRRREFFRQNLWSPPNYESLANYLSGALVFEVISGSPFQKITVSHGDGEFALWLLTTAYFGADELLREQAKVESAIKQANIEAKLAVETNVQFQDALRGLLVMELGREITRDEALPYAARIIEPPIINNQRTEPNIQRVLGVPAVAYAGGGFFLTTLIAVFRRERRKT